MRADRLIAVLLMLQRRGKVTAAEVADELEVSVRTARRDLEALAMAGLPVYATRGRGGGWELLGGGRTDLSGLSSTEARALFTLIGPAQRTTPEVRAALRKLVRALPESMRQDAEVAAASTVVDPSGWGRRQHPDGEPPMLAAVQDAVIDGAQLRVDYRDRAGDASTRVVHPLGVAAKGSSWYLVAGTDGGLRTFRVDRLAAVERTGHPVQRPADFDLVAAWGEITETVEELRAPFAVRALADGWTVNRLRFVLGPRLAVGAPVDDRRVEVVLRGHDARSIAAEVAGLGPGLEVLDPVVRSRLSGIGVDLVRRYG